MEQTVRDLLSEHLLDDSGRKVLQQLSDQDSLIENGLLDSMGMLQLLEKLEQTFEVTVDSLDVTIEAMETVDAIVTLVKSKQ